LMVCAGVTVATEKVKLTVAAVGKEAAVAALDHRDGCSGALRQPFDVDPTAQRNADEGVPGRIKLSRSNARRTQRRVPVVLGPLALVKSARRSSRWLCFGVQF